MEAAIISQNAADALDLLEQIEAVNEMIELHIDDEFMREQYEYRKRSFVKDLVELLAAFKIDRTDLAVN
ncbi:MAG: hypothetical protein AAGG68_12615 [Bacteroidota bacterium]